VQYLAPTSGQPRELGVGIEQLRPGLAQVAPFGLGRLRGAQDLAVVLAAEHPEQARQTVDRAADGRLADLRLLLDIFAFG
jgi:hypothetical protein